jgi:hypothetical protein
MLQPGDALLVKGSRSVGLELVTDELMARHRSTGSSSSNMASIPDSEPPGSGASGVRS